MTEIATENKSIADLEYAEFMKIVRSYSQKVALLAQRGDPLSATVKGLWEYLYDHRSDPKAEKAFRAAFVDWMRQHLEITSRVELARKYGYLVEGEDPSGPPPILTLQ